MKFSFKGLWRQGVWVELVNLDVHTQTLLEIEEACFPEAMRDTPEFLKDFYNDSSAFGLILFKKGQPIGLISGCHISEECLPKEVLAAPSVAQCGNKVFYIDNMSMVPSARNPQYLMFLFQEMAVNLISREYVSVVAAVRVSNGFSRKLKRILKSTIVGRDPTWHGFDEPFDFSLIDLAEVPQSTYPQRFVQRVMRKLYRIIYR